MKLIWFTAIYSVTAASITLANAPNKSRPHRRNTPKQFRDVKKETFLNTGFIKWIYAFS